MLGILLLTGTAPASAGFVSGSFKLNIGESSRVLDAMLREERGQINHDQFVAIKMEEMWKSPNSRLVDRNRPTILLQNISDSSTNNEIAEFTIDINQLGYEFGNGDFTPDIFNGALALVTKYSDSGVTLSASYGAVSDSDPTLDTTKLKLNIGGLTPGKALMFRVDLDPVPMNNVAFPDYQCILTGASDVPGETNTPASIVALFASGSGENRMTTATAPADFIQGVGQTFIGAGLLEAYHDQSGSHLYSQTGGTEIPEPSTLLLVLAGAAGLLHRGRQR